MIIEIGLAIAKKKQCIRLVKMSAVPIISKAIPSFFSVSLCLPTRFYTDFYSREQWTYGPTLLPSSSYLHTL